MSYEKRQNKIWRQFWEGGQRHRPITVAKKLSCIPIRIFFSEEYNGNLIWTMTSKIKDDIEYFQASNEDKFRRMTSYLKMWFIRNHMHTFWKLSTKVEVSPLFLLIDDWNADLLSKAEAAIFHPKVEAISYNCSKTI